MQIYNIFYKQFGIRRLQGLLAPRLFQLVSLPRDSLVHYLTYTGIADIDIATPYLKGYAKPIQIDLIDQLVIEKGTPRRKSLMIKQVAGDWLRKNKHFRYFKEHYKVNKDPMTLLVNSYNYLPGLYRYVDMPMTSYYQWLNLQATLWTQVDLIARESSRQQFVFINLPNDIPSYSLLKMYSDKVSTSLLKLFDTPEKLMLLEVWKWLSVEYRGNSVLSKVNKESYGKVNLVFTNSIGDSAIINLGYLNSWIKDEANLTEFNSISQIEPVQLQKVFLKFTMTAESQTVLKEEPLTEDVPDPGYRKDSLDEEEDLELKEETHAYYQEHSPDEEHATTDDSSDYQYGLLSKAAKHTTSPDQDAEVSHDAVLSSISAIDEDIESLDDLTKKKLQIQGLHLDANGDVVELSTEQNFMSSEELQRQVYTSKTPEESLVEQIQESAGFGLVSAADYKKLLKDVEAYKSMKDPYGSKKTITEAMVITAEDIQIDAEKSTIVSSSVVADQSMLKSSLQSFSSDYINNVLHKDVLAMTADLQKAGVVIRKHEIEQDHSALGAYENHTIELKPIDGQPSTVRFRLPIVNEDSTFICNGNKYVMRSQRVDLPIRKIDPTTVALTSYYGKTFVSLSTKKANSSLEWIAKKIHSSVLLEDPYITEVAPGYLFDNNFKAPFIYNGLASMFKSFRAGGVLFTFNHTERDLIADPELIAKLESDAKNPKRLVGYDGRKLLVLVDYQNIFHAYQVASGELHPLGDIYHMLQLDPEAAPVDFAELRVFSKQIPVGVVVAYYIGFEHLLRLTGVQYRVVTERSVQLEPHEYMIRFKDRAYVFSRKEIVNSYIFGGFDQYEKLIRQYEYREFNQKNVYLNLIQSKGLSSIYIRELDSENKLFVDSITKSILEDMHEPTTFLGLLLRSTEMLTRYDHPDSQDMSQMRIRGYERLSGAVYKEMVGAIRQYRNRNISGRSKIDISPFQVWKAVLKDPSIKIAEDINPIQNLKETEVVTYTGEGGRSKESINKASRAFHVQDTGVIAEATVDSSDVGINTYLSPDPNFKNLRGQIKPNKDLNPTNMVSTSTLLAVGSNHDD